MAEDSPTPDIDFHKHVRTATMSTVGERYLARLRRLANQDYKGPIPGDDAYVASDGREFDGEEAARRLCAGLDDNGIMAAFNRCFGDKHR